MYNPFGIAKIWYNDFMKKILIGLGISALALFTLFAAFVAGALVEVNTPVVANALSKENAITNLDPYKMFNLINDYRASKGLNKLVFNPKLCDFTKQRLAEIHTNYSHDGFSAKRVCNPNEYCHLGENLARGYSSEEEAVKAWIASPEHVLNILDPNFTQTCIASDYQYEGKNLESYIVQEFSSNY